MKANNQSKRQVRCLAFHATVLCVLVVSACGMRSALSTSTGTSTGGVVSTTGGNAGTASGVGGQTGAGGKTTTTTQGTGQGGSAGDARASTTSSATGGVTGQGGSTTSAGGGDAGTRKDGSTTGGDAKSDATVAGAPTINPSSGYVTLATGAVTLSGYVSSYMGGSGSTVTLTYDATSFCSSGTVAPSTTYNSWAGAGFNVNQAQSGSSGSTGQLVLYGTSASLTYVNSGGSTLEFQLWDGSDYWCYQLPAAKTATTISIPFSSLNTQCWNNAGTSFTSGTPITAVQLVVPGSATTPVSFSFCFLGLTIQ